MRDRALRFVWRQLRDPRVNDRIILTLKNSLTEIRRLSETIGSFAETHQLTRKTRNALELALDELVTNVICYGFDDEGEHSIEVRVWIEGDQVIAEIEDDGREFDPRERPEPEFKPLETIKPGGLGIHLARKMMDQMDYCRSEGRNLLRVSRRLA